MAAASARRDLFLQVNGSIGNLERVTKAGKSLLLDLGQGAIASVEQIEAAFREMGSNAPAGAVALERSYTQAFNKIRQNAKAIAEAPTGAGALQIIDAAGATRAAEAATSRATALRIVAEAAQRAAVAEGADTEALRAYATAAAAAAVEAEDYARGLQAQAGVLTGVKDQVVAAGLATERQAKRTNAMNGLQKAGLQQLSFQLGDVATQYASGTSASVIFAQQSGQVIQALQLMMGEGEGWLATVGKFAPIVGAVLVVLTPFVAKLFEGADAAKKHKESALELEDALTKEKIATDAATEAMKDYIAQSLKAQNQDSLHTQIVLDLARARLADAVATREQTRAELEKARAKLDIATATAGDPNVDTATGMAGATDALNDVARLNSQIAAQDARIATLTQLIQSLQVKIGDDLAPERDERVGIERRWTREIDRQHRLAMMNTDEGRKLAATWVQTRAALEAARDAELKRYDDAHKKDKPDRPTPAPMTSFIRPVDGGRVTSGFGAKRSYENHPGVDIAVPVGTDVKAPAAGVVKFVGEKGLLGNTIVINFGGGTEATFGHLSKFNVKPGDIVNAGDVIGLSGGAKGAPGAGNSTGPHLHYAVRVNGRLVDPLKGKFPTDPDMAADKGADSAATARVKEAERVRAFQNQLGAALQANLRAQLALTQGTEDQVDLKLQEIADEKAARFKAIDEDVAAGKLKPAEADQLKAILRNTAVLEAQAVMRDQQSRLIHKQYEAERVQMDRSLELLQLQGDLAETSKERRRIALAILELEEKKRRALAQAILDDPKSSEEDRDKARADLAQIDELHPLRVEQINRQTAGPMDQYRAQLRAATADMNEALEGVAVHGLQTLEDGIMGVIDGTETLAGAFKKMAASIIADLVRIAIQKAILAAIGGGKGGDGGAADSAGSFLSAFGFAAGRVPGFAGGMISGPGTGTSDSIPAWLGGFGLIRVANGESIMTAAATRRFGPLLQAMNDNEVPGFAGGLVAPLNYVPRIPRIAEAERMARGAPQRVQVEGKWSVEPSPLFDVKMRDVATRTVGDAAEPITAAAEARTMRRLTRPVLPGAGFG